MLILNGDEQLSVTVTFSNAAVSCDLSLDPMNFEGGYIEHDLTSMIESVY